MKSEPAQRRASLGHATSLSLHALALGLLLYRPEPQILSPSLLQKGNHGVSQTEIFLSNADLHSAIDEPSQTVASAARVQLPRKQRNATPPRPEREREVAVNHPEQKAGVPDGTMYAGAFSGHDVRPALPEVFPDPQVARAELPAGLEGDVVVEVTIDSNGTVIGTKLLQGLHPPIEQKVLATVQQWRFKPATRDGVPIPSRQDVHFHFPS